MFALPWQFEAILRERPDLRGRESESGRLPSRTMLRTPSSHQVPCVRRLEGLLPLFLVQSTAVFSSASSFVSTWKHHTRGSAAAATWRIDTTAAACHLSNLAVKLATALIQRGRDLDGSTRRSKRPMSTRRRRGDRSTRASRMTQRRPQGKVDPKANRETKPTPARHQLSTKPKNETFDNSSSRERKKQMEQVCTFD